MGKNRVIFVRNREISDDLSEEKSTDPWADSDGVSTISCELPQGHNAQTEEVKSGSPRHSAQVWPENSPSRQSGHAFQQTAFYRGLSAVILPLKVFGLFSLPHTSPSIKWGGGLNLWIIYSAVIISVTGLHFARSLAIYRRDEDFGEVLFFKLQQSLWYMECLIKAIVMVSAWYRKDRLAKFFTSWSLVCNDKPPRKPVRLFAICASVFSLFFVVLNCIGCAWALYGVHSLEDILMTTVLPLQINDQNGIALKTLIVLVLTLLSAVAMFPVALLCVIMFALYHEFKDVHETVRKSLCDGSGEFIGDMERVRLHHQKLCKLVDVVDNTFNVIIAFAYMTNIPNLCLVMYSILYFRPHVSHTLLNTFWMLFILVHISIISVFGAWVNSAAHSPLSDIYSIRADNLSSVKQFEINLFLSKLNGDGIGVTALQMFVINRPTILTVAGLLLTYFVLLVQFKNSTVATCVCNISGVAGALNGSSPGTEGDL